MWLMNWPFLKRNWASDKAYLEGKLRGYGVSGRATTMLVFPEGLGGRRKACRGSGLCEGARALVPPHHVPTYKVSKPWYGLSASQCASAIYDVTLSYTGFRTKAGQKGPGPFNVFVHEPQPGAPECAFHIHVRRLSLAKVNAKDDAALKKALFDWFEKKDSMMDEFLSGSKRFPGATKLDPLPASRWAPALLLTAFQTAWFFYAVRMCYKVCWILLFHKEAQGAFLDLFYSFKHRGS